MRDCGEVDGYVIFAILQLAGAKKFFGQQASESGVLRITAIIFSTLFFAMIFLVVKAVLKKDNPHWETSILRCGIFLKVLPAISLLMK